MKKLSPELQGAMYAIISGLLYGLVGYFGVKLMDTHLSISNMQFWRFFISTLFMSLILIKQFKIFNDNAIEMLKSFLFGALFYSAAAGIYFVSSQYIGTGPSMVILFTYPAFVMLLNWLLFKNKISKMYYLAIALIVFGMTLLVDLSELKFDIIGIGLGVVAGILHACYIVFSKRVNISPLLSTLMVSFGCAVACLVVSLWNHNFIIPSTTTQWMTILGFGIISTALPMLLFLEGLKKINAEKASLLSVLEPVFVVIFGIILLEELIDLSKVIGIIIILSGALLTLFGGKLMKLGQNKLSNR